MRENKFLCILCYIGFLFVIPLVAKPQSRYVKYHANQGLLLFLFEIVVGFVTSMFSLVFGIIHLGFIAGIVNLALSALSLFFMVYGIIATCEWAYQTASGFRRPVCGYSLLIDKSSSNPGANRDLFALPRHFPSL